MVYRGFLGTYAQGEEGFLWRFWLDGEMLKYDCPRTRETNVRFF